LCRKSGCPDQLFIEYDEKEAVVRVTPPMQGRRTTFRLGVRLTLKEIEESIERGQTS